MKQFNHLTPIYGPIPDAQSGLVAIFEAVASGYVRVITAPHWKTYCNGRGGDDAKLLLFHQRR